MISLISALAAMVMAQDGAVADLGEAASRAAEWNSFAFSITETVEGGKKGADPVTGTYEKGKGLLTKEEGSKRTKQEILADGKRAYTRKDGTWRARVHEDPIEPPHAILADLEKNFKKLETSGADEGTVYSGDLTEAGRLYLLDSLNKRVSGKGEATFSAKVTVNFEDQITRVEIIGVRDNVVATRVFTFTEINEAVLEIPEEAEAVLANPEAPKGAGLVGRLKHDLGLDDEQTAKFEEELNGFQKTLQEIFQGIDRQNPDAVQGAMDEALTELDAVASKLKEGLSEEQQGQLDQEIQRLRQRFGG